MIDEAFKDTEEWTTKTITSVARMSFFTSDVSRAPCFACGFYRTDGEVCCSVVSTSTPSRFGT